MRSDILILISLTALLPGTVPKAEAKPKAKSGLTHYRSAALAIEFDLPASWTVRELVKSSTTEDWRSDRLGLSLGPKKSGLADGGVTIWMRPADSSTLTDWYHSESLRLSRLPENPLKTFQPELRRMLGGQPALGGTFQVSVSGARAPLSHVLVLNSESVYELFVFDKAGEAILDSLKFNGKAYPPPPSRSGFAHYEKTSTLSKALVKSLNFFCDDEHQCLALAPPLAFWSLNTGQRGAVFRELEDCKWEMSGKEWSLIKCRSERMRSRIERQRKLAILNCASTSHFLADVVEPAAIEPLRRAKFLRLKKDGETAAKKATSFLGWTIEARLTDASRGANPCDGYEVKPPSPATAR